MNELYKTLTFVAVALALTGAAFVSTRDRTISDAISMIRDSRFSTTSRTRWPAPTWKSSSSSRRRRPPRGSGDVQGQEVGDPVALQLSGRRQGPALQDVGRPDGPYQGHDPVRQRRGPGGDGRDRSARRQGHDPQGPRQADHPPGRVGEGSRRLSSSATRSRDDEDGPCIMCGCPARSESTA